MQEFLDFYELDGMWFEPDLEHPSLLAAIYDHPRVSLHVHNALVAIETCVRRGWFDLGIDAIVVINRLNF